MNTTLDALLADTATLTKILSYHVVPGVAALAKDLKNDQMLPTLLGPELTVVLSE